MNALIRRWCRRLARSLRWGAASPRRWIWLGYFGLALALTLALGAIAPAVATSSAPAPADLPAIAPPHLAQTAPAESPASGPSLSEKVQGMEGRLEAEFESFFNRDLVTVQQSGDDITASLSAIARETGSRPAVFWVIPEDEYLHLVLIRPGETARVVDRFDVPRDRMAATVRQLRADITNPLLRLSDRYMEPARTLYDWIVAPYEADLAASDIDTLLVCLGRSARGLPLAALHDGEGFLVERYAIATIPAFNLIDPAPNAAETGRVLAMGASEFETLAPLPAVPVELATIVESEAPTDPAPADPAPAHPRSRANAPARPAGASPSDAWPGQSFLNADFTRETLRSQLARGDFSIVHLATHATFEPGSPENSAIALWNDRLSLAELPELNWERRGTAGRSPVELLVLSACRTAVGDDEAELGFAGLALQAGVKSALASLWYVSDAGTLALMTEFYQDLRQAPNRAEALRRAQLRLLRGDVRFADGSLQVSRGSVPIPAAIAAAAEGSLSHPYYWAGFTLVSSPW